MKISIILIWYIGHTGKKKKIHCSGAQEQKRLFPPKGPVKIGRIDVAIKYWKTVLIIHLNTCVCQTCIKI